MDEYINAVKNMQNYISEHLTEHITLSALARVSCYSPWYSYRLFVRLLGVTPADYIRKLRLSRSALELRNEKTRITTVAFDYGFASVDGYQRAFYREFGCNPKEYSSRPIPIYLFTPYVVSNSEKVKENKMEKVKNVFIQVVEKPERKVIIKRGVKASEYFEYCGEVGCEIWGLLVSMCNGKNEPVSMWLPKKYVKPNTSTYVQGVEVDLDFDGVIPEGFDVITLPKSKFIMFQGEPFNEEDYENAILEMWEAEKKFQPSNIGYSFDDENPKIQLEPRGERGYIELIPIK